MVTDGLDELNLVADINPGSSSSEPTPYRTFFEFDGWLYFSADDGISEVELFRTDGFETSLVEDINKVDGSFPADFTEFDS